MSFFVTPLVWLQEQRVTFLLHATVGITIVIVNHNYGRFLKLAIDSALSQTVKPTEIVVVDDGSTDNSATVISDYGNQIHPVFKAAGGHVSAVNAGYAVATGAFCIFLDADDLLYANCIETVLNMIQLGDVKLQYRLDTIDQDGVDQNMPFPHFPPDLTPTAVLDQAVRFGVYPWTVSSGNAFSRQLLDELLPINTEQIYRSPDGYLSKMAPLFGNVRSIPKVLGAYRVHGTNAWAQPGSGFTIAPIVRWLHFDRVLQAQFELAASDRGIRVTPYNDIRSLQQMEYRLLAFRFAPAEFAEDGYSAIQLVQYGISAAKAAPNTSVLGRGFWMAWLFSIAYLPKSLVRFLFRIARAQTGRSKVSRWLIKLARGRSSFAANR